MTSNGKISLHVAVWEWQNSRGAWRPYSPEVSQLLERGHHKHFSSLLLGDADPRLTPYTVNLTLMKQIHTDTGSQKCVRRSFLPLRSPAGSGVVWQWRGGGGGDYQEAWHGYSMPVQCIIEDAWAMGNQTVNISEYFPEYPYLIDFCNLSQHILGSNVYRPLRRQKQASYPVAKPPPHYLYPGFDTNGKFPVVSTHSNNNNCKGKKNHVYSSQFTNCSNKNTAIPVASHARESRDRNGHPRDCDGKTQTSNKTDSSSLQTKHLSHHQHAPDRSSSSRGHQLTSEILPLQSSTPIPRSSCQYLSSSNKDSSITTTAKDIKIISGKESKKIPPVPLPRSLLPPTPLPRTLLPSIGLSYHRVPRPESSPQSFVSYDNHRRSSIETISTYLSTDDVSHSANSDACVAHLVDFSLEDSKPSFCDCMLCEGNCPSNCAAFDCSDDDCEVFTSADQEVRQVMSATIASTRNHLTGTNC